MTQAPAQIVPARTPAQRLVKRIRVPMGFVTAAVFLWFARPSVLSLAFSLLLVAAGLWLRGYAAGYVKKNAELTRTGPYAYTRNPLYLGSLLITLGFGAASASWLLTLLLVGLFALIYIPTILAEEQFLRANFQDFDGYAAAVPRLLPRLTPAAPPAGKSHAGKFSKERYQHHREYNALIGAGAIYCVLILRLVFAHLHHP